MNRLDDGHLASLFAAGVLSAFRQAGGTEKDAEAFLGCALEKTARRRHYDDDEEDEDSTWWDRNKAWMIPTLVGTSAFLIGGDAGRHGRPDRSLWSNAGSQLWKRIEALLGIATDPVRKSYTDLKDWAKHDQEIMDAESRVGPHNVDSKKLNDLMDNKAYV